MFEEQRIIFTCSQPKLINNKKSNEMKKYRNEIDLFGKVKPAVRIQTVRDPRTVPQSPLGPRPYILTKEQFQSRSTSDPTFSDIDLKNKMALV